MDNVLEEIKFELFGKDISNGPPVTYMGGKWRYANEIIKYFPSNMATYVEPFTGGGAVYFKTSSMRFERIVLNDLNNNLINLFRSLRDDFWKMLFSIYFTSNNINFDLDSNDNYIRAASYYVALFSSFNGQVHSGIHISRSKFMPLTIINRLFTIRKHLERAEIWSTDGIDCIKENDSENTLFYIDPPYMIKGAGKYYELSMQVEEHKKLLDTLTEIKGKFILSYEHTEEMDHVLDGYNFHKNILQITNSSSNIGHKQNEFLITNFVSNNMQESLALE